jgi:hypothetical protein
MRHRSLRILVAIAALSLAGACSSITAASEGAHQVVDLGEPFDLRVGRTAVLLESPRGTPFRVTFLGVTGESRCPEDVRCVWEGDARVVLHLERGDAPGPGAGWPARVRGEAEAEHAVGSRDRAVALRGDAPHHPPLRTRAMSWPFGLDTGMLGGWLPYPRRSAAVPRHSSESPRRASSAQLRLSLTREHPVAEG